MDNDFWHNELGLENYRERSGTNSREGSSGAAGISHGSLAPRETRKESRTDFPQGIVCDQLFQSILPVDSDFFGAEAQLDEESTQRLLLSLSSPTIHDSVQQNQETVTPDKGKRERFETSDAAEYSISAEVSTTRIEKRRANSDDSTVSLKDILALALPRVDPYSRQRLLEIHSLLRRGSLDIRGFIRELRNVIGPAMLRELATELENNQSNFLEDENAYVVPHSEANPLGLASPSRDESIDETSTMEVSAAPSTGAEVSSSESAPLSTSQSASATRPKKRAWTRLEHYVFLKAMQIYGRGKWKYIADVLPGRTPNQVASHAKKFFLRQRKSIKDKRMRSIHDLILSSPEMREVEHALESGAIETPGFDLAALGIARKVQTMFPMATHPYHDTKHGAWGARAPVSEVTSGHGKRSLQTCTEYGQMDPFFNDPVSRGCDMRLRRLEYTAQLLRQTISTMRAQTCGGLVDPRGS
ncbi:hypothetical protein CCYA_CCYA01G0283 [Cyanidiococcus yangmingshanensis]|nr:hypothetical protein CCYA_CCYA01G0283 [Cyanidiococcus yangmingshanensis]